MKKTTLLLAFTTLVWNAARHACLWAALGLLAAVAFGPSPAQAAVAEAWVHRYNDPAYNDHNGNIANAVAVDRSGNVVVTGYSYNGELHDASAYYTAKYAAADGALLWEQRCNDCPAYLYDDNRTEAVTVDDNGNVVVTGTSHGGYYTAKYAAADGALLWEKRYDCPVNGWDEASAVAVDNSGNVVVTGSSYSVTNNATSSDYYTAKYAAADGALLWEKPYNGPANGWDEASAVAVDGSGNVVVTGTSRGPHNEGHYYTAKYAAADGALLWEQRYNGPDASSSASSVAVDGRGNVVVTGTSTIDNPDGFAINAYYTAKYAAADGALLWEQRYNGPGNYDQGRAVAVDGSGNVVVTGSSSGDYYTAKYAAANGALLWEQRYNGPANYYDEARAVAVDNSGNAVVTGISLNTDFNFDYYTAKYAAADGALLWEKRYNGYNYNLASSLALGPNGIVAITGSSSGDYATIVYRDDVYPIFIALVPAGVRLRFIGIPGRSYTIERASAVTGPWATLNTQTVPASGLLEYLDANLPAGSAFYRTAQP